MADLEAFEAWLSVNKAELYALQLRVENGLVWLTEHDPAGRFHLWYAAGLTPLSKMPAQDEATIAAFRAYYEARKLWEDLDRRCSRLEGEALREFEAAQAVPA